MSSGIEFDEDKLNFSRPVQARASSGVPTFTNSGYQLPSRTSKMAQWLMKHGIKSAKAAESILVIIVILNIIITFIVIKFFIL